MQKLNAAKPADMVGIVAPSQEDVIAELVQANEEIGRAIRDALENSAQRTAHVDE